MSEVKTSGKPLSNARGTVIGVDIGATGLKAGLVDHRGNLGPVETCPTLAHEGPGSIMARIFGLVDRLLARQPGVLGIGVGSAGRINHSEGLVQFASGNLPGWTGTRIGPILAERYGLPVVVDNDANVAALAEGWVGAARGCRDFLCLTIGTGVGGGFVVDGHLARGAHWGAAEFGHMVLYPGGEPCNCGGRGCLEQYVSGPALVRRANRRGFPCVSAEELVEACRRNDPKALGVIDGFVSDLAWGLITLQNIVDPEVIIAAKLVLDYLAAAKG